MSDQFNYKLVTPEKIYLEGDAQMVVLPGAEGCLLYTSPSPRDVEESRMPSSA